MDIEQSIENGNTSTEVRAAAVARRRLVGALLIVGALASWVIEALVAAAWIDPDYSYVADKVSALGVPGAPGWAVMDATWAALGVLIAVVAVLLGRAVAGRRGRLVTATGLAQGIGFVLFAAFHDSVAARADGTIWLYFIGAALGIVAGNALPIAVGPAWPRLGVPRWTGLLGVTLGAVGLISAVATLGWVPLGLAERISIYTFLLWQLALGLALTAVPRRRMDGHSSQRAGCRCGGSRRGSHA